MKYSVNDRCIGCALCCDACPEVFVMTGEGVATVHDQPEDGVVMAKADAALAGCPVDAICKH